MSQINISLGDLLLEKYGKDSKRYKPLFPTIGKKQDNGRYGSPYQAFDLLGRKYYLPVEMQVGDDKAEALGVKDNMGKYTGRWRLPYSIISAEMNTHIIDTELTERDGMVSELINLDGFKIHIRGFLINQHDNGFPEDDFNTLNRLIGLKSPVRINNPLTDILMSYMGNDKMVTIRTVKFPEHPGVNNIRPYELDLATEVPFSLIDIS